MEGLDLFDRLFGPEQEDGCVEHWAAIEALLPGTVERLPANMQEALLQYSLLEVKELRFQSHVDRALYTHPCIVHGLWAKLFGAAPPLWDREKFLAAGGAKKRDWTSSKAPCNDTARLYWLMLAEMGACCAGRQAAAIARLEDRGAPLGKLLCRADSWDSDDPGPGEKALARYLLETASENEVRRARAKWVAWQPDEGVFWTKCIARADKVLRWRGARAAWASAVARAGLSRIGRESA